MKNYPIVNKKIPEKIYREIHRSLPLIWVDIVITDGKEFLLAKRTNEPKKGQWWLPGGRLLKNEPLEKAAARFLKREAGLSGKIEKLLGFHELFEDPGYFKGMNAHGIAFVFKIKAPKKSKISLDPQHSQAKWFREINRSWDPYVKKFLKKSGFK